MSRVARVATRVGLLLLGLTAISLITMPVTQHLWTWDRYLHGGQDFETNALLILTALNLVLVLAECCKRNVGKLLAAWQCFSLVLIPPAAMAAFAATVKGDLQHRDCIPIPPSCPLPLLI